MRVQLPIENFEAQDQIFKSNYKYKIIVKGRRFGLTRGMANNFIERAAKRSFKKGLWVDTINANIDRYIERYFIPALKQLPKGTWDWRKQAKIIDLFDSYIDFRSADTPESIEGFGYDLVFLNEAGIILKDEYLWTNAIKPMLWDYDAECIIGGTPKGAGGEFEKLAKRGDDPDQPLYKTFRFTSFDNPYIHKAIIEQEIKELPQTVIDQEIYGKFISDSGAVFRNIKNIMVAEVRDVISGHIYVMGVDLAKVQDWTVITVYDSDTNEQVYQDRFNQVDWMLQKKRIAAISARYNNARVFIDATGVGDPIVEDLSRIGVPVEPIKFTNESKKQMIEKIIVYTEQGMIHMLDLPETLREFSNFTYDMSSSGKILYNAPNGFHDDIVMSHCLAIWGLNPIYATPETREPTRIRQYLDRLQNQDIYE